MVSPKAGAARGGLCPAPASLAVSPAGRSARGLSAYAGKSRGRRRMGARNDADGLPAPPAERALACLSRSVSRRAFCPSSRRAAVLLPVQTNPVLGNAVGLPVSSDRPKIISMSRFPDEMLAAADHLRASRFEEAESAARRALECKPDDAEALTIAGLALLQRGLSNEAVAYLARATAARPTEPAFHNNLGEALR